MELKMEIGKLIICLAGFFLVAVGSILVYDSRIITKKIFSFTDQNDGTFAVKIAGFTLGIIGGLMIIFFVK